MFTMKLKPRENYSSTQNKGNASMERLDRSLQMLEAIGITHHGQAFIRGRLLPFFKALSLVFLLGMTIDDFACAQTTTQKHMTSGQCQGNDHNPFSFGNPCRNCTLRICDVSKIDKIAGRSVYRIEKPQTPNGTPSVLHIGSLRPSSSALFECAQRLRMIKGSGARQPHVMIKVVTDNRLENGMKVPLFKTKDDCKID